MRTELLFESCPFLTSANVTLSRLGFADGDALWEIMQDEELYRYEYEAPAKERVQAEYKIQDANAQFAAKRTVTLGVYANTDLAHLIGWIEIGGADEGMNMVQLRFLFGRRCVGTEYPAEAMGALCRYLFEMARVNRVQSVCLDADIDKQRILEKSGFQREGVLRECHRWEPPGRCEFGVLRHAAERLQLLKEHAHRFGGRGNDLTAADHADGGVIFSRDD